MGLVVAATHVELRKPRAIKFMLPDAMHGRESVERFLREARTAAELKSQHAVKIHDVARLPTGEPYIVMEYLEGTDFRALLKLRRVLPVYEAVTYMLQVCEALAEAHAAGIVHRDLKPANMFLARGVGGAPCVKVLDFGIAKLDDAQASADEVHLTRTDVILGSPLYMSPEQIISTKDVDGRSDIWSLGVILYGFVTGELPFRGESAHVVFAAVQRDPPPPPSVWKPDLPAELERIILRCLEKDPARRYATVEALAADLSAFAAEGAHRSYRGTPAPLDPADTQLPTQVWRSSSGQISFPYPAPPPSSSGQQASSSNGGTQVMAHRSMPMPSSPHGDMAAPVAQTNSPMVQSIAMSSPANNRARGLFLAGGGFGAALGIVALVVVMSRGGGSSDDVKQPAAAAPPTNVAPPPPPPPEPASPSTARPVVTASTTPEPAMAPSPAPAAPASTTKTAIRTAPTPTAKAPAPVATAPATAKAPVKGPPVRRRDD
ncbi:serine/threonine protein kinase [Polyangium aurulentum]|nr:serine/threonine protein kinase [Polyangium aurulentum]